MSEKPEEQKFQKRSIAYKCSAVDIHMADFVKQEGWSPNYLRLGNVHISRVNVIGTVVEKQNNEQNIRITIDDGTASLVIFSFETVYGIGELEVGNVINVVGKPRIYGDEKYVMPEMIKKIDSDWIRVRQLELELQKDSDEWKNVNNVSSEVNSVETISGKVKEDVPKYEETKKPEKKEEVVKEEKQEIVEPTDNSDYELPEEEESIVEKKKGPGPYELVFSTIQELDTGNGASFDDILSKAKLENVDSVLMGLLERGEIFEIKPGRYKILE